MLKKKSPKFFLLLPLLMMILAAGCGSQNPSAPSSGNSQESGKSSASSEDSHQNKPAATGEVVQISFGGSAPGGVYYYMVGVMANLLSQEIPDINVTNVSTGASVANVIGVASGELHFGLTYGSLIYEAWNGIDTFKDNGKLQTIRGIAKAYESPHYFVVKKDSGIQSISDLQGKRVAVGPPGSGAQYNSDIIFNELGIDVKREYLSFADAGRALKEGKIDALAQSGAPSGAVTELAETTDIVILPFSDQEMEQLTAKTNFYHTGQLPAGTYKGVDQPIQMPYFTVYWIANEKVPDEIVEKILEVAMDPKHRKTLVDGHPLWAELTPDVENYQKLNAAPLHPGAVKFYEKKGLK